MCTYSVQSIETLGGLGYAPRKCRKNYLSEIEFEGILKHLASSHAGTFTYMNNYYNTNLEDILK